MIDQATFIIVFMLQILSLLVEMLATYVGDAFLEGVADAFAWLEE